MKYFTNKYLIISAFLLFSIISMGCSTTSKQNDLSSEPTKALESKAEMVALAKTEENNNDFKKAIFYYIQALDIDNQDFELLYQIGYLQNRLHNTDLAVRAFNKALEINLDYIPALAQMGIYYLEQKRVDKARVYLKHAVLLDQQRLKNTDTDEGLADLDKNSPLLAYNVYAVVNDLDSRHEYAREIFTLLLKTSTNTPLIYTNLGYSYYLTNDYAIAQSNYKKALDLDPNFERAKLNLGLIYVRNGQYNRAIRLFKQVMTDAQAYNDIGYFLMLAGRYEESEYFLQNAIDLSPSYFEKGNINLENVSLYLNDQNSLSSEP